MRCFSCGKQSLKQKYILFYVKNEVTSKISLEDCHTGTSTFFFKKKDWRSVTWGAGRSGQRGSRGWDVLKTTAATIK